MKREIVCESEILAKSKQTNCIAKRFGRTCKWTKLILETALLKKNTEIFFSVYKNVFKSMYFVQLQKYMFLHT